MNGKVGRRHRFVAGWAGVLYYRREGRVRGVMLCNVWDRVEAARGLIRGGRTIRPEDLKGAIR